VTLRQRLLAASLAVGLPLAVALFFASEWWRLRSMDESLTRYVASGEFLDTRARCQNDPIRISQGRRGGPGPGPGFGPGRGGPPPSNGFPPPDGPPDRPPVPSGRGAGEGPPFEVFAYDASFQPADRAAPPFPREFADRMPGDSTATSSYATPEGRGVQMAIATPWPGGPCALMLARMRPRPGEVRDERLALAAIVITVIAAVWVAAGPVVVRMRRLKEAVSRSAESRYTLPVPEDGGGELADLARAFNTAGAIVRRHLDEAEARETALREFVANTTHDVALPLTVLQGHLAELEQRTEDGSPEREYVRGSVREAHYMGSLLQNLGIATKLEAGPDRLELKPVALNALVDRVVARHRPISRMLGVELNHAVPEATLSATSDVTLLEQALSNLVENAVRYNTPGGHVAVVLDRHADRFTLTVADDGPGVPAGELTRLTERRFRGEAARTRRPDGHGLGLSIAAEAVARVGGSLSFHPSPEGGLTAEISGNLVAP
jgi:signal transduction histidine kinase